MDRVALIISNSRSRSRKQSFHFKLIVFPFLCTLTTLNTTIAPFGSSPLSFIIVDNLIAPEASNNLPNSWQLFALFIIRVILFNVLIVSKLYRVCVRVSVCLCVFCTHTRTQNKFIVLVNLIFFFSYIYVLKYIQLDNNREDIENRTKRRKKMKTKKKKNIKRRQGPKLFRQTLAPIVTRKEVSKQNCSFH